MRSLAKAQSISARRGAAAGGGGGGGGGRTPLPPIDPVHENTLHMSFVQACTFLRYEAESGQEVRVSRLPFTDPSIQVCAGALRVRACECAHACEWAHVRERMSHVTWHAACGHVLGCLAWWACQPACAKLQAACCHAPRTTAAPLCLA